MSQDLHSAEGSKQPIRKRLTQSEIDNILADITIQAYITYGLNGYGRPMLHPAKLIGTPPPPPSEEAA